MYWWSWKRAWTNALLCSAVNAACFAVAFSIRAT
jgi:hypothetical protein